MRAGTVYQLKRSVERVLRESSAFFRGESDVHKTLRELAKDLDRERISYAVIGGMALNLWGYVRQTQDIDVLLTKRGLEKFRKKLAGRGYVPVFPDAERSFRNSETGVHIEIVTAGEYPGDGKPKSVSFPNPSKASQRKEGYRVISLEKLIELKLASGLSAPHRLRDLSDVLDLVRALNLPKSFRDRLDPSVQEAYVQLWNAARGAKKVRV